MGPESSARQRDSRVNRGQKRRREGRIGWWQALRWQLCGVLRWGGEEADAAQGGAAWEPEARSAESVSQSQSQSRPLRRFFHDGGRTEQSAPDGCEILLRLAHAALQALRLPLRAAAPPAATQSCCRRRAPAIWMLSIKHARVMWLTRNERRSGRLLWLSLSRISTYACPPLLPSSGVKRTQ